MAESSEMLRLRALLGFYNDDNVTVTGLSRSLGEEKYTISRLLSSLEEEGLVDRSNNRHPKSVSIRWRTTFCTKGSGEQRDECFHGE